ncbi:hypothetical protein ACP70R_016047 [Stipagrostis hirtigluma subsp. patula]
MPPTILIRGSVLGGLTTAMRSQNSEVITHILQY